MTDERNRQFVARIDLSTGRHSVREASPRDPRPSEPAPPLYDRARPVPPEPTAAAPTDAPTDAPSFPWVRTPVAEQPQPQDADRHNFPTPPQPAVHVPPASPSLDEAAAELLCERVVARVRESLGLPPEEPPIPLLEPDGAMTGQHVAGAFVTAEAPTNPAGAFADEPSPQHPAGAFAETG